MNIQSICSPGFCNVHDVGMVVSDEGGSRPSGRNPWRGFCLRIEALDAVKARANQGDAFIELSDRLARLENTSPSQQDSPPQPAPVIVKPLSVPKRRGGVPL